MDNEEFCITMVSSVQFKVGLDSELGYLYLWKGNVKGNSPYKYSKPMVIERFTIALNLFIEEKKQYIEEQKNPTEEEEEHMRW